MCQHIGIHDFSMNITGMHGDINTKSAVEVAL